MFLNSIPVVGHVKGLVHYMAGDEEGGDRAMLGATRTTLVVAGGIAGSVAGPAGAAAGAAAGGMLMDGVTSLATDRPQGLLENIDNIVTDVEKGKVPIASTLGMGLTVGTDMLTGVGAGAIASSATQSIGSTAGKSAIKSAGSMFGKTLAKDTIKRETVKRAVIATAAVTTAAVVLNKSSKSSPYHGGGSFGNGGGGSRSRSSSGSNAKSNNSGQSSNTSSNSKNQSSASNTKTQSTDNSNNSSKSKNTSSSNAKNTNSSGSGSQPPKNNKDNSKKGCQPQVTSILAKLLEIFGVNSLDDICIEGQYIFKGLNSGQKNFLKTRLQNLKRQDYDIEDVVKIIVRIFKQVCPKSEDINYKNFLSLMEFVATFISEQVDHLNNLFNDNAQNLRDLVDLQTFSNLPIPDRMRQLAAIITSNLLSPWKIALLLQMTQERIVSIFRDLHTQISRITLQPGFRNILSAIYHYYKHRHVPEENRELSVTEYFDLIKNLLKDIVGTQDYRRLETGEIPDLQLEVEVPNLGKIRITLKYQNGKVNIASVFIIN